MDVSNAYLYFYFHFDFDKIKIHFKGGKDEKTKKKN